MRTKVNLEYNFLNKPGEYNFYGIKLNGYEEIVFLQVVSVNDTFIRLTIKNLDRTYEQPFYKRIWKDDNGKQYFQGTKARIYLDSFKKYRYILKDDGIHLQQLT